MFLLHVVRGYPVFAISQFEYTEPFEAFYALTKWQVRSGGFSPKLEIIRGEPSLYFKCNFEDTSSPRAVWDLLVDVDMSDVRGIQLSFSPEARDAIPPITVYFRSSDGWYFVDLFSKLAEVKDSVAVCNVLKSQTMWEGSPNGWKKIDCVRLAVWRTEDRNVGFFISAPKLLRSRSPILILRAESMINGASERAKEALESSARLDHLYSKLGLNPKVIGDLDVFPGGFEGTQLMVLPYNSVISPGWQEGILKFIDRGGKILSFFEMPLSVANRMDISIGKLVSGNRSGQFSKIRCIDQSVAGFPEWVMQSAWTVREVIPNKNRARTIAEWFDYEGRSTGYPAIVLSPKGAFVSQMLSLDDQFNKQRLVLALTNHFLPSILRDAVFYWVNNADKFLGYPSVESWFASPSATKHPNLILELLDEFRQQKIIAQENLLAGNYWQAYDDSERLLRLACEIWARVQKPSSANEFRGFWCHSPFGAGQLDWNQTVRILAESNFTAVFPNVAWSGYAFYPSEYLPYAGGGTETRDYLQECIDACRQYRIECHVWVVCCNLGHKTSPKIVEQMKRDGRLQVRRDGKVLDTWLCPSHPLNRKLLVDIVKEIATKYDVQGIHFDYIRFESSNTCFCEGCKQQFEKYVGVPVNNLSKVTEREDFREKWNAFRREVITSLVQELSEQIRNEKPSIKISAAVFPNWSLDRDGVAQDWKLWCSKRYLDFVCPMTYTADELVFRSLIKLQKQWAGGAKCYPGIGLSTWDEPTDVLRLWRFITATREVNTGGFVIFDLKESVATEVIPLCGKGICVSKN